MFLSIIWLCSLLNQNVFYNHVYLTFIQWVLLQLLGKLRGVFCSSLFFRRCISSYTWKKCWSCQKQGSSHLKQLTMENCVLNICNSILTFYPIDFYIFYCPFFHLLSLICRHCNCISWPLPPIFTLSTVVYDSGRSVGSARDVTVSMCVCERMTLSSVNHITVQFYFQCHSLCVTKAEESRKNMLRSAHGTSHWVSWNIIQSDGENFTINVRQASIADLTTVVSINGLLLSVLLLHCVDFVIWNKCLSSFCMFFTMLKVAAIALIIIIP